MSAACTVAIATAIAAWSKSAATATTRDEQHIAWGDTRAPRGCCDGRESTAGGVMCMVVAARHAALAKHATTLAPVATLTDRDIEGSSRRDVHGRVDYAACPARILIHVAVCSRGTFDEERVKLRRRKRWWRRQRRR